MSEKEKSERPRLPLEVVGNIAEFLEDERVLSHLSRAFWGVSTRCIVLTPETVDAIRGLWIRCGMQRRFAGKVIVDGVPCTNRKTSPAAFLCRQLARCELSLDKRYTSMLGPVRALDIRRALKHLMVSRIEYITPSEFKRVIFSAANSHDSKDRNVLEEIKYDPCRAVPHVTELFREHRALRRAGTFSTLMSYPVVDDIDSGREELAIARMMIERGERITEVAFTLTVNKLFALSRRDKENGDHIFRTVILAMPMLTWKVAAADSTREMAQLLEPIRGKPSSSLGARIDVSSGDGVMARLFIAASALASIVRNGSVRLKVPASALQAANGQGETLLDTIAIFGPERVRLCVRFGAGDAMSVDLLALLRRTGLARIMLNEEHGVGAIRDANPGADVLADLIAHEKMRVEKGLDVPRIEFAEEWIGFGGVITASAVAGAVRDAADLAILFRDICPLKSEAATCVLFKDPARELISWEYTMVPPMPITLDDRNPVELAKILAAHFESMPSTPVLCVEGGAGRASLLATRYMTRPFCAFLVESMHYREADETFFGDGTPVDIMLDAARRIGSCHVIVGLKDVRVAFGVLPPGFHCKASTKRETCLFEVFMTE